MFSGSFLTLNTFLKAKLKKKEDAREFVSLLNSNNILNGFKERFGPSKVIETVPSPPRFVSNKPPTKIVKNTFQKPSESI